MENQYDYYSTFKFYDEKGRRLSAFAEENGDDTLDITVFPCSFDNEFSKKEGRRRYEDGDYKVAILETIPVEDNAPRKTFMNYCRDKFYSKVEIELPFKIDLLIKRGEPQDE